MMRKVKSRNFFIVILLAMYWSACKQGTKETMLVPQIEGNWWQITTTYPNIAPYQYKEGDNKVCDFTIFQAKDSSWQIIACVRGNTYPGSNRFLYRWESKKLEDTLWLEKGVFLSTGTSDKADGWGHILDTNLFKKEGLLQAPHCIIDNNQYFLFYNNAGAHGMKSDDGIKWEHLKNKAGNCTLFEMGRDLMIYDDRNTSGNWIAYYTTGDYPQFMGARTTKDLFGNWSEETKVYDGFTNTRNPIYRNEFAESPFVIKEGKNYYMFSQFHVFVSENPLDFNANKKVANLESSVYEERAWAPEIIEDANGQLYIAAYRTDGIWMAKLKFVSQ